MVDPGVYAHIIRISVPLIQVGPPGYIFCTHSYNHTHRLRLEKLLCLGLSRSPNGFLKVLLDPGGGLTSETAARWFQKQNGRYETVSEVKRLKIYNGYMLCVTAIPQRTQVSVRL